MSPETIVAALDVPEVVVNDAVVIVSAGVVTSLNEQKYPFGAAVGNVTVVVHVVTAPATKVPCDAPPT